MSAMNLLLAQSAEVQKIASSVEVGAVLSHSISIGLAIATIGFILDSVLAHKSPGQDKDHVQRLIGSSNLLLICVGVSGMMLLIEQNIVRAVVLFAALALVRFRVRVSEKSLGATFFFSVIGGMACGMGEFKTAWVFTSIFIALMGVLAIGFQFLVPIVPMPGTPQSPEAGTNELKK